MTAPGALAPALCSRFIGASRGRVTLLDQCGRVAWGPKSQASFKGFVQAEIGAEVSEGEDYEQRDAGGELCFSDRGEDAIKWWNISLQFCNVDPDVWLTMYRTWKPVTNAARTQTTGVRPASRFSNSLGFALELWPKVSSDSAGQLCVLEEDQALDPDYQVTGYALLPWVVAVAPDNFTFENAPTTFTLKGRTRTGSLWGRGPYNVTRDADGNPAPLLDPIDPGFDVPAWGLVSSGDPDPFHLETVSVRPPAPTCGAFPLWNPDATAPVIDVVAAAGNTMRAQLTVTNFATTGNSGIVNWGDGSAAEAVTAATGGVVSHTYAVGEADQEQTITYTPGNGAAPVTDTFTPTAA